MAKDNKGGKDSKKSDVKRVIKTFSEQVSKRSAPDDGNGRGLPKLPKNKK